MKIHNVEESSQLWRGVAKALSNLVYVAAGAISLSITFLGYLLSNPSVKVVLSISIKGIPIIYILFSSWILLFISILLATIAQFFIERYIFDSHSMVWGEEIKERTTEEDKPNVDIIIDQAQRGVRVYNLVIRWIQKVTITSFTLGIFFLVTFVIILINHLVLRT